MRFHLLINVPATDINFYQNNNTILFRKTVHYLKQITTFIINRTNNPHKKSNSFYEKIYITNIVSINVY